MSFDDIEFGPKKNDKIDVSEVTEGEEEPEVTNEPVEVETEKIVLDEEGEGEE